MHAPSTRAVPFDNPIILPLHDRSGLEASPRGRGEKGKAASTERGLSYTLAPRSAARPTRGSPHQRLDAENATPTLTRPNSTPTLPPAKPIAPRFRVKCLCGDRNADCECETRRPNRQQHEEHPLCFLPNVRSRVWFPLRDHFQLQTDGGTGASARPGFTLDSAKTNPFRVDGGSSREEGTEEAGQDAQYSFHSVVRRRARGHGGANERCR
jgi:hypothetical protein